MEKGVGENLTRTNKYACACAIVASMISIIFGYDTGVMSGAMIFVKEEFNIGDAKTEVLAGILNLCALAGSLCAGRISDYIGRRHTIVIASLSFLCGSVVMGYVKMSSHSTMATVKKKLVVAIVEHSKSNMDASL